jgi:hypothetical protein
MQISGFANENNFTVPGKNFRLHIWHDEQLKSVKLYEHFIPITESSCNDGYFLDPNTDQSDAFNILANGSIHLHNQEKDTPQTVFGTNEYCVMNYNVNFCRTLTFARINVLNYTIT